MSDPAAGEPVTPRSTRITKWLVGVALVTFLGGLLFGYASTVPSAMRKEFGGHAEQTP
jgi:Sec-independent protein secretion pathway component TatC